MPDTPTPDAYETVLADLRAQREKIDQTITLLEALRRRPSGSPTASDDPTPPVQPQSAATEIGPGEFLGMTIVDASKKLLTRERRAMGNAEILAALERGGLVLKSADPLNVVSSVLTRRFGQVGDVVRVARGTWGLKEWYPNRSFKTLTAATQPRDPESLTPLRQAMARFNKEMAEGTNRGGVDQAIEE